MSDALLPRRVSRIVEILQLLIPHVLGSNPTHNFVVISACVHSKGYN